jgi:hypothetical protein
MVMSLGVVVPAWRPDQVRELPLKMPKAAGEFESRSS